MHLAVVKDDLVRLLSRYHKFQAMLKQRIITAVVLALIVTGTIFGLDSFYVSILLAIILLFSMLEMINMTSSKSTIIQWIAGLLVSALFFLCLPLIGAREMLYQSYLGLLLWVVILLFLFSYKFSGTWRLSTKFILSLFSTVLFLVCINGLYFLHAHFEQGAWMLMYVLTLVWVADIGAYFSGKNFGRHKLAPGISPGKTWEGVIGGLLLNALWISIVFQLSGGWGIDYFSFLILGLVTSALSVVGDLYESILKREAGLKDSGNTLPGHGGVLDRIDSVIAATPVFLSGLFILGAV